VKLENDCRVLNWRKVYDPNLNKLNAELLTIWEITNEKNVFITKDRTKPEFVN